MEQIKGFVEWAMLENYPQLIVLLSLVVQGTKSGIDKIAGWLNNITPDKFNFYIPTKLYVFLLSYSTILIINIHGGTFKKWDLVIYFFSAIVMTVGSNGVYSMYDKKK